MIYLIGGPPRCGKTTLAKSISRSRRCGWVSIDILEEILFVHSDQKSKIKRFPKNDLCKRTGWENDPLYCETPIKTIVNAYRTQGHASWKAIEIFVENSLFSGHDFILEGHQIHPALASRLVQRFSHQIQPIFIYKHDPKAILKGFKKQTGSFDWPMEKTRDPSILPLVASMLSQFGIWFAREARRYRLPAYEMDRSFKRRIQQLTRLLTRGSHLSDNVAKANLFRLIASSRPRKTVLR